MRALDLARVPEDAALLPKVHVNMGITLEAEGMLISACEHYRWAAVLDCACCLPCGECGFSAAGPALPWDVHGQGAVPQMHLGGVISLRKSLGVTTAAHSHGRLSCWQLPCLPEEVRCWQAACNLAQQLERMRSGGAFCSQLLRAFRLPSCRQHSSCWEAPS